MLIYGGSRLLPTAKLALELYV